MAHAGPSMNARFALLIDVGSTWTKGLAVALDDGALVRRCQHPTTLAQGIMHGAQAVINQLESHLPTGASVEFRAATSSAAGGLRVGAIGLVPDLTGLAAKQASLGAGARVVFSSGYAMADDEIEALYRARIDIILLTGGTDGGNTEVIIQNARRLAQANRLRPMAATVVLAGNKSARDPCLDILREGGFAVVVAGNVLPTINELSVESAQAAIREVFLDRIVEARGIHDLRAWATGGLLPTPRAVLEAAAFLADGPAALGTTVLVDIGGATTDVHSIGGENPPAHLLLRGLREPRVKRTVEGDLGLRVSAAAAADVLGAEMLSSAMGNSREDVIAEAQRRVDQPETLEDDDPFDRAVAIAAVAEALNRHAGFLERSPMARDTWFLVGKDLREARAVIASGGIFAVRPDARELLAQALLRSRGHGRLVPDESATLLIDSDYVMFAVGLLAARHAQAALRLAQHSLHLESSLTLNGTSP